jgi:DNA repair exonuclease SbcCD ATPase subunit
MRIKKVRAGAFGPLRGEELELADGMTVISGPNESGKSTWNAAIYAALCGMRRGRGAPVTADREFRARHLPWAGDDWRVSAVIELDGGRTVELHHDLSDLVDCHATDTVLGSDLTGEILFEGTPDGSAWLGLNRRTFHSVACVRQAQILQVIEDSKHLQDDLQRAAATAGADQTAARALELIDEVQREWVGLDRANSTRPLRQAKQRLAQAQQEEERVRRLHDGWQTDLERLADLRARAGAATGRLGVAEAAQAAADLAVAEQRLERIRELAQRNPIPPPEPADPARSGSVDRALAEWDHRPHPSLPHGDDATTLRAHLDALPAPPPSDLPPVTETTARPSTATTSTRHTGASGPALAMLGLGTGLLITGIALAVFGPPAIGAALAGTGAAAMVAGAMVAHAHRRVGHGVGHGVRTGADPDVARLEARLQQSERARQSEQRAELERRLQERTAAEQRFATDQTRVAEAAEALRAAARGCGLADEQLHAAPDVLAEALRTWRAADQAAAHRRAHARQEWGELQALLAGHTPEQLEAEVAARRAGAAGLAGAVDAARLSDWTWGGDPDQQLARLRAESTDLDRELAAFRREVEVRTDGVCSVAEAVEAVTAAQADLDAVETLGDDLATARRFLADAQDRAHRNIAPRLADAIQPWLGHVTCGRYQEVRVDPEKLEVRVMAPDGRWRAATQLSQGTTEQIYLLLRIAMADILTTPGMSCPLLLDDVLVQSDPQRSLALLELLVEESDRRQVILFSQEDDVTTWARERLTDDGCSTDLNRHRHIELPASASVGTRSSAPPQRPEDPDLKLDPVQPV